MTHAEKVRARGRDLLNRVAALNAEEFNELRLGYPNRGRRR